MKISKGTPTILGATKLYEGINFALFIKEEFYLNIFDKNNNIIKKISSKKWFKTGNIYHILIKNLPDEFIYSYEIDNIEYPDIYGTAIEQYSNRSIFKYNVFDWEEDNSPNINYNDMIIYETHLKGFTELLDGKSCFKKIKKTIPHLKALGITSLELLPIFEFNNYEYINSGKVVNYWGYSPINFFCPKKDFSEKDPIYEFKDMIKNLHKENIEVILDVVYNHSNNFWISKIPSLMEINKESYYKLNKNQHVNETGCGNTINSDEIITQELILNSLRYWVTEMHIDGFRFDLASFMSDSLYKRITEDPILKNTKLIAEPWSLKKYELGRFSKNSKWLEWNDKFRDSIRKFIRGDNYSKNEFATRFCGSQDIFQKHNSSVNFITAHDGFSLMDLVSYNKKNNFINNENNRDGSDNNYSYNYGVEGQTNNKEISILRIRQIKNFLTALILSKGTPMLYSSDEYGHTKNGNNNSWCQDNEINWFNWKSLKNSEINIFLSKLIKIRKKYIDIINSNFYSNSDIKWFGENGEINWESASPFLACIIKNKLLVIFNPTDEKKVLPINQKVVPLISSGEIKVKNNVLEIQNFCSGVFSI